VIVLHFSKTALQPVVLQHTVEFLHTHFTGRLSLLPSVGW